MRASRRLMPFVIAAVVLASPLSVVAAHSRCLANQHACGQAVLADSCCCNVLDARGIDPMTTQSPPAAPPVFLLMPDRTAPAAAMLRIPPVPPLAGHVSLNTLFATLLV